MKKFILPVLLLLLINPSIIFAQAGCTDPLATNYDAQALVNDGSCVYPPASLSVTELTGLATPLFDETSGILIQNNNLWTHVDDSNTNLFRVDSTNGAMLQQLTLTNTSNNNWEDITGSQDYIYVGDFGNNYGNRTNLRIYRIPTTSVNDTTYTCTADTISFTFSDQTDFTPAPDNTRYDCEAFVFYNDSLHLFSKDWVTKWTRHYALDPSPGQHVAELRDSFYVDGLVTSAAIRHDGVLVLLCYDNVIPGPCFAWMFYDYPGSEFFNGNKRKFSIGSAVTYGQTEGICLNENGYGYITNERFTYSLINVPPKLWSFDLSPYISPLTTAVRNTDQPGISVYPNPSSKDHILTIDGLAAGTLYQIRITSINGTLTEEYSVQGGSVHISTRSFMPGNYIVEIRSEETVLKRKKISVF